MATIDKVEIEIAELVNIHKMNNNKLHDIMSYRNQALIGTINLIVGIVFTTFMIIKNKT
jgi:hypothetical protein